MNRWFAVTDDSEKNEHYVSAFFIDKTAKDSPVGNYSAIHLKLEKKNKNRSVIGISINSNEIQTLITSPEKILKKYSGHIIHELTHLSRIYHDNINDNDIYSKDVFNPKNSNDYHKYLYINHKEEIYAASFEFANLIMKYGSIKKIPPTISDYYYDIYNNLNILNKKLSIKIINTILKDNGYSTIKIERQK